MCSERPCVRSEPALILFFTQRSTSEFQSAVHKFPPDEEAKQTENILILAEIRQDGAQMRAAQLHRTHQILSLN